MSPCCFRIAQYICPKILRRPSPSRSQSYLRTILCPSRPNPAATYLTEYLSNCINCMFTSQYTRHSSLTWPYGQEHFLHTCAFPSITRWEPVIFTLVPQYWIISWACSYFTVLFRWVPTIVTVRLFACKGFGHEWRVYCKPCGSWVVG